MPFDRDTRAVPINIVLERGPGPPQKKEICGSEPPVRCDTGDCQIGGGGGGGSTNVVLRPKTQTVHGLMVLNSVNTVMILILNSVVFFSVYHSCIVITKFTGKRVRGFTQFLLTVSENKQFESLVE